MSVPVLKIKKNYPDAVVPVRQHETDSGLDLHAYKFVKLFRVEGDVYKGDDISLTDGTLEIRAGERVLIDTGVSATVGPGYEIQIRPRSGLALKQGLTVLNTPGTIDASYTGMLGVILVNLSMQAQPVKLGDRVAQMVVCPVILCGVEEVDSLDETKRGAGGFGHTGT
jgi:dUTP pyrophosphatase